MTGHKFVSYAQNREDVVLWRALGSIRNGRYVEIGANDPVTDSITKAFYDRGWSGLEVEPEPEFARRYRAARGRDVVVEAAVTSRGESVVLHRIAGTGLSTTVDDIGAGHTESGLPTEDLTVRGVRLDDLLAETGFDSGPVHFCVIDVEGAEADVLAGVDLRAWRPWVLVIEATEPASTRSTRGAWEADVLKAGYEFCLFDGLSCFYVAEEHAPTLAGSMAYGATATDDFELAFHRDAVDRLEQALSELAEQESVTHEWRTRALVTWAAGVAQEPELAAQRAQVELLQLALDEAKAENQRLAAKVRNLRRRLRQSPTGVADRLDGQAGSTGLGPRIRDRAARTLSRRGR